MNTTEEPNPFRSPDNVDVIPQHSTMVGFWVVLCATTIVALGLIPYLPGISVLLAIVLGPAFIHAYVRLF